MVDITFNGMTMEYNVVAGMMDEEVKNAVLITLNGPTEQEILDAYMKAHKDKFGSDFLQSI